MVDRKNLIGSSDIAVILGLSPWKSALQLWAEKTGEVEPKDLSDNEAVEWGTRLERVVSRKFAESHGVKLMAYKRRFQHKKYPFLSCELDNIIVGTDEIVEIKTTNAWAYRDWRELDSMPEQYICQVLWALGISGRKKGHVAVLIGGQKYLEKTIEFDQEFFDDMVQKALAFWECVKKKEPPVAVGIDNPFLVDLEPVHDDNLREADEDVNNLIAHLQEVKMHLTELFKQKDDAEAKLKQIIGSSLGVKTSKYIVTWKKQERKVVDVEKLKADDLYEQYKKVSSTRVLRIKKEAKNG